MSQAFLPQRSMWQYERYVPKCGFVQSPELRLEKAEGEMDHTYDGDFLFFFKESNKLTCVKQVKPKSYLGFLKINIH